MRQQRTKSDWALELEVLLQTRYEKADKVILVSDNLNTHTKGTFYEAFEPERARSIVRRLEFRYTPKHGSWLNVAENELSSLTRQCLKGRRLGDLKLLQSKTRLGIRPATSGNAESIGNSKSKTHATS